MGKRTYFLIFSGKTVLILSIVIALVLISANCACEPLIRKFKGVEKGVEFMGRNVGGYLPKEVEELVTDVAKELKRDPIDAVYDKETETVIPEINGITLDEEATVKRIIEAKPGTSVTPIYKEIKAQKTLDDYPLVPVSRGNPQKNAVSLIINVAWGNEYLPELLYVLSQENVRATFFLVGRWAAVNPELVRLIKDHGHELGNHGHTDSVVLTELTFEEILFGLQETNKLIQEISGQKVRFFAPHKGEYNEDVQKAVAELEMRNILWSVDTVDWMLPGVLKMVDKVKNEVHPGAMILMHPTAQTADFLSTIIPFLKEEGYQIQSVSEHLSPTPFLHELP